MTAYKPGCSIIPNFPLEWTSAENPRALLRDALDSRDSLG